MNLSGVVVRIQLLLSVPGQAQRVFLPKTEILCIALVLELVEELS